MVFFLSNTKKKKHHNFWCNNDTMFLVWEAKGVENRMIWCVEDLLSLFTSFNDLFKFDLSFTVYTPNL